MAGHIGIDGFESLTILQIPWDLIYFEWNRMMQPEARNCSRGFGIKYIHVCLCDPLLQYGGIVRLLKRNPKKTPENREDAQSAK